MSDREVKPGAEQAFLTTGRPVVTGTRGAVACPHHLASQAGLWMLEKGGHAVDACIAMNATLAVVYDHMAGVGGDVFAQVYDASSGEVTAINGSGRSGREVSREKYAGRDAIPQRGPLAANTVPGAVDGWWQLHQRYGRLDWAYLFEPAIDYANEGFPISQKYADYIAQYASMLSEFPAAASVLMPGGVPPAGGDLIAQSDLGRTMTAVSQGGADEFYRGELARRIVESLRSSGGLLTEADFAEHRSDWVQPLRTTYKGLEVTELPPNTQGISTLLILNLIEGFDINMIGDGTADYYHLIVEATKIAFQDRDAYVTDPDFAEIPYERLLSKSYAEERRSLIDMHRARPESELPSMREMAAVGGDTTYMCAVDRDGNACSLIQSVYHEFGSAFMPEGTGILMQNRGSFFKLDPSHPNTLEPNKRTFHTIIPAMALENGEPRLVFGTMGGEGQPQTQNAMLTRGHDVEMLEHYSQKMGHAQAIMVDDGVFYAAADPRGDGEAIAW